MKEILQITPSAYGCGYLNDLEYKRTGANGRKLSPNVSRRSLRMQILFPSPTDRKDHGPYPMVIFATGGSWLTPHTHFCIPFIVPLARRGFLVAVTEYRGCEEARCEDAVSDLRSAVRYMRKNATEYNGDPDHIFLMGCSAGAHLSMLAAYTGNLFDDPGDDLSVSADVSGVLELFGPSDCSRAIQSEPALQSMSPEQLLDYPYARLAHCHDAAKLSEMLIPYTPLTYVTPDHPVPPTLIAQGESDPIVPVYHGESLHDRLTAQGREVEYYLLQAASHGNWRFFETEMMDRYEGFIRKHL